MASTVFSGVASTCTGLFKMPVANFLISLRMLLRTLGFVFSNRFYNTFNISNKSMSSIRSASSRTNIYFGK
jgi:hypothetical protein